MLSDRNGRTVVSILQQRTQIGNDQSSSVYELQKPKAIGRKTPVPLSCLNASRAAGHEEAQPTTHPLGRNDLYLLNTFFVPADQHTGCRPGKA